LNQANVADTGVPILQSPAVGASTKDCPLAVPHTEGILVAEQLAEDPELTPEQDQEKVLATEVTREGTPEEHNPEEGVSIDEPPLALPHTPLTVCGAEQVTSSVVIALPDPLHDQE
jgi:hypothetical protein